MHEKNLSHKILKVLLLIKGALMRPTRYTRPARHARQVHLAQMKTKI